MKNLNMYDNFPKGSLLVTWLRFLLVIGFIAFISYILGTWLGILNGNANFIVNAATINTETNFDENIYTNNLVATTALTDYTPDKLSTTVPQSMLPARTRVSNENKSNPVSLNFSLALAPFSIKADDSNNAWNCIPITQSTTSTPVTDPDWSDPIKAFDSVFGLFGQRSSETVLHLSIDVLNWSSGCSSQDGHANGTPIKTGSPNFLTQTPPVGDFILAPCTAGPNNSCVLDSDPDQFFLDFSHFNLSLALLALQITWGCFCFIWRRRDGEGDLEDIALRTVIGCAFIVASVPIMQSSIGACNLFNNLFLDQNHSMAIFDFANYHMDEVDANMTDPLLDALGVVSALFAMQMITRYLSLAFLIMTFPLAGILWANRATGRFGELMIRSWFGTVLVQPVQLAILYLSSLMIIPIRDTGSRDGKALSILFAVCAIGFALAIPKLLNSLSGGTTAIGALALAKGGINLYQNSATGAGEGVVKNSLNGLGRLLGGGLMGAAVGGLYGFTSSTSSSDLGFGYSAISQPSGSNDDPGGNSGSNGSSGGGPNGGGGGSGSTGANLDDDSVDYEGENVPESDANLRYGGNRTAVLRSAATGINKRVASGMTGAAVGAYSGAANNMPRYISSVTASVDDALMRNSSSHYDAADNDNEIASEPSVTAYRGNGTSTASANSSSAGSDGSNNSKVEATASASPPAQDLNATQGDSGESATNLSGTETNGATKSNSSNNSTSTSQAGNENSYPVAPSPSEAQETE